MINIVRKNDEQRLLLLRAIADSSPIAYYVVDNRTDEILYFNKQFCIIWKIEHLVGKMLNGLLKNNDIIANCLLLVADEPGFIETCKSLQDENNHSDVENEILFKDERIIRRFSGQIRDEGDNYIGRLFMFEDITEKKQNELKIKNYQENLEELITERTREIDSINKELIQEIEEKHSACQRLQRYRILSENSKDIILFINNMGEILEANTAAITSYGYSYKELLRLTINDLSGNGHSYWNEDQFLGININGASFETIHKRKDGTIFNAEVNTQVADINGERILLSIIRDITKHRRMEEKLKYIARHDYLTGIPNRFYLEEFLKKLYFNKEYNESAFLYIDLDNFKKVNDSFGHSTGDELIKKVSTLIGQLLNENDFFARLGGDEFAIVLPGKDPDSVLHFSHSILEAFDREIFCLKEACANIKITASIGITMIGDSFEIDDLFSYADAALYEAKRNGKNRSFIFQNFDNKNEVFRK